MKLGRHKLEATVVNKLIFNKIEYPRSDKSS